MTERTQIELGAHIGMLTIVRRDGSVDDYDSTWWVQCDCGSEEKSVRRSYLIKSPLPSCGCNNHNDLTKQIFGRLTVVRKSGFSKTHNQQFLVLCLCGTEKVVSGRDLISGNTKSCGCLALETRAKHVLTRTIDLTNQRFGKLLVLRRAQPNEIKSNLAKKAYWIAQCDCGSESKPVCGLNLRQGKVISCGCYARDVASIRNLKKHLQCRREDGTLYLIILSNEDERFLKFGFSDDVERRFDEFRQAGYQVDLIHTISGDSIALLYQEDLVHGRHPKHGVEIYSPFERLRHKTLKKFGGYTECYRLEALESLRKHMDVIAADPMAGLGDYLTEAA